MVDCVARLGTRVAAKMLMAAFVVEDGCGIRWRDGASSRCARERRTHEHRDPPPETPETLPKVLF